MAEITAPKPPAHLPKAVQAKWVKTHADALKQAKADNPELPEDRHRATALKAANQLTKVPEPADYAEAAQLVDAFKNGTEDAWKIIGHGTRVVQGEPHLAIVTANGKKHLYPIPKSVAKKPAA